MPVLYAKVHTMSYILHVFTDMCSCVSIFTELLQSLRTPGCFISLMEDSTPKPPETTGHFYSFCHSAASVEECQRVRNIHPLCDTSLWLFSLRNTHLESSRASRYNVITHLCFSSVLFHHGSTRVCLATCLLKGRCPGVLPSSAAVTKAA